MSSAASDPEFTAEQAHLTETYGKLEKIGRDAVAAMEAVAAQAAEDKKSMAEELAVNFATWDDILETHADIVAMNNIIEAHDMANSVQAERLRAVEVLLREPYFAKIALRFKEGAPAKELYIGSAGISDENYRRLVVDWRSPVAEVYYNQAMGPTSYVADGRVIHADLLLRRQFEIDRDQLLGYFDSDVAIEDKLLLASLSRGRSAHMQAITATIQKEQNIVVRHADVPVLQVAGVAGSGKTSVLMQRIAYLFYQHRGTLDPAQVFLISPNPVFGRYIDRVLPDLGERNPEILTWAEFLAPLLPAGRGAGEGNVSYERLRAIDAALAGVPVDERFCLKVTGPDLDAPLAVLPELPDLFLCANDFIAMDTMQSLRKLGKSVPGDVLLCGFDDAPESRIMTPALTTVHIHTQIMAFTALHLLLSRMKEPYLDYRTVYTATELICRDSTKLTVKEEVK